MFAVPGWSVPSKLLKTQDPSAAGKEGLKSSRKRKRKDASGNSVQVTNSNVADLWQQHVVEKKDSGPLSGANGVKVKARKQKEAPENSLPEKLVTATPAGASKSQPTTSDSEMNAATTPIKERSKKKEKRKSQIQEASDITSEQKALPAKAAKPPTTVPVVEKPASKLTPLQAAMRQKLISARFRHLNQTLYTAPSTESQTLFDTNPSFFDEYHEGFRQQVSTWPENPVDSFVAELLQRGKVKDPRRDKKPSGSRAVMPQSSAQLAPLPRTSGTCVVADLGCGDAALATQISAQGKKLNIKVLSFDLQSPNPIVTKADISNLPVASGSTDITIFCLALMGTNWTDFIDEAYRILHWKGELWVAEIKSRFSRPVKKTVDHSVGKRRKVPQKNAKKEGDDDNIQQQLMVEVDGADNTKQTTDVTSFVQVLQKRGFVLNGEAAVDLSNKMFVKLKFIKGANPVKGKNVREDGPAAKAGMKRQRPQFLEGNDEDATIDEASVLKPCLYKIR